MTIMIHFHQSGYRTFKGYYEKYVRTYLSEAFPKLVSYNRFVRLMPCSFVPLVFYMLSKKGTCTGISFVDSTPLRICKNKRIERHRVFSGIAARGKGSMGYFYGFKLHLVVNDRGEIPAIPNLKFMVRYGHYGI